MGPGERGKYLRDVQMPQTTQLIQQQSLFDDNLLISRQMLQAATTANAKVGTLRINPAWRGTLHGDHPSLGIIAMHIGIHKADPLAGQGPFDKGRPALDTGQAASVMGKGFNVGLVNILGRFFVTGTSAHVSVMV